MIKIGDSASMVQIFSYEHVSSFAKITSDQNPIHLDEDYAASTRFGKRIVHGMLVAGLISAVLGMRLPGPGSIYINQSLNFRAPVYINDQITATATVKNIRTDKPIVTVDTVCTNQEKNVVIDGEAVLLLPSLQS